VKEERKVQDDLKDKIEESKTENKQAIHRGNFLEKELVRMNRQNEDKLHEMDRLYRENDKYKDDLSSIALKYDLDTIDKNTRCLEAALDWSLNIV
jgi:ribosomal 50S subunit-associated protein YjgA (DUF615 family)